MGIGYQQRKDTIYGYPRERTRYTTRERNITNVKQHEYFGVTIKEKI